MHDGRGTKCDHKSSPCHYMIGELKIIRVKRPQNWPSGLNVECKQMMDNLPIKAALLAEARGCLVS